MGCKAGFFVLGPVHARTAPALCIAERDYSAILTVNSVTHVALSSW